MRVNKLCFQHNYLNYSEPMTFHYPSRPNDDTALLSMRPTQEYIFPPIIRNKFKRYVFTKP